MIIYDIDIGSKRGNSDRLHKGYEGAVIISSIFKVYRRKTRNNVDLLK